MMCLVKFHLNHRCLLTERDGWRVEETTRYSMINIVSSGLPVIQKLACDR